MDLFSVSVPECQSTRVQGTGQPAGVSSLLPPWVLEMEPGLSGSVASASYLMNHLTDPEYNTISKASLK